MKIATYNVNGVNGRLPVLLRWLKEAKDKKDLVNTLNNDYRKPTDGENDADIEEQRK